MIHTAYKKSGEPSRPKNMFVELGSIFRSQKRILTFSAMINTYSHKACTNFYLQIFTTNLHSI